MAGRQQEADKVLDSIKEKRSARACYPCAKRKIRCAGGQPCETCSQRRHPDICFYPDGKRSTKRRREDDEADLNRPAPTPGGHQSPELPAAHAHPSPASASTASKVELSARHAIRGRDTTILGSNSMASFLRDRLDDTRPSLGLVNHSPDTFVTNEIALNRPSRSEVFRFFPSFRTNIFLFAEVVPDGDAFELSMLKELDALEAAQAADETAYLALVEKQRNRIAMYLAALALGVQMSDLQVAERSHYALDFGKIHA
jgi:hypothetical protein